MNFEIIKKKKKQEHRPIEIWENLVNNQIKVILGI